MLFEGFKCNTWNSHSDEKWTCYELVISRIWSRKLNKHPNSAIWDGRSQTRPVHLKHQSSLVSCIDKIVPHANSLQESVQEAAHHINLVMYSVSTLNYPFLVKHWSRGTPVVYHWISPSLHMKSYMITTYKIPNEFLQRDVTQIDTVVIETGWK